MIAIVRVCYKFPGDKTGVLHSVHEHSYVHVPVGAVVGYLLVEIFRGWEQGPGDVNLIVGIRETPNSYLQHTKSVCVYAHIHRAEKEGG